MKRQVLTVFACIALLPVLILSAQEKPGTTKQDQALRVEVLDRLTLDHWLQGVMPDVSVEAGVVRLSAKLKSEVYRKRILKTVEQTPGVKGVVDRMEIAKPK
ncbi:MAG: BON domain-containing protein [Acidobacteria bacterium]|nr:BON domain-containing protein [Acidobacteriota bacterium]